MQFSVLSAIVRSAREYDVPLHELSVEQDTLYHIEGSFLAGNARGSAEPPVLHIRVEAGSDDVVSAVGDAIRIAPALALSRDLLENRFGISIEGGSPKWGLDETFEHLQLSEPPPADVIEKLSTAERVENDPHGAGVGLRAEQKRTIHVKGRGEWLADGLFQTNVDLVHPIGSSFRFRADESGEKAPPPEAFLVAGVAFCYMTQLGRYAAIRKRPLSDYRIFQENRFLPDGRDPGRCRAHPFLTQVLLDAGWSGEAGRDLVVVGERTCFLHATMRQSLKPVVTLEWKGESVTLPG
jgi:hypothetical protein